MEVVWLLVLMLLLFDVGVDVLFDYFGWFDLWFGIDDFGFCYLLMMVVSKCVWVKVLGVYWNDCVDCW